MHVEFISQPIPFFTTSEYSSGQTGARVGGTLNRKDIVRITLTGNVKKEAIENVAGDFKEKFPNADIVVTDEGNMYALK